MPAAYLDPQEWMWGLVDRTGSRLRRTGAARQAVESPLRCPKDISRLSVKPSPTLLPGLSAASVSSRRAVFWPSPLPDKPS